MKKAYVLALDGTWAQISSALLHHHRLKQNQCFALLQNVFEDQKLRRDFYPFCMQLRASLKAQLSRRLVEKDEGCPQQIDGERADDL